MGETGYDCGLDFVQIYTFNGYTEGGANYLKIFIQQQPLRSLVKIRNKKKKEISWQMILNPSSFGMPSLQQKVILIKKNSYYGINC